jgi:membrane-associated phospholipid phosphatase
MELIIQWGLSFIEHIQQIQSPFLISLFQFFTILGNEVFYLIFFPFVLWCINFKLGIKIGILFLISVYINGLVKILLEQPRPFDILPKVKLYTAEGFGFPSGHAQGSILIWCSIAYYRQQKIIWYLAFCLTFLIGFSRIYLGVHFPHDVVGGWVLGGLIFFIYHYKIKYQIENKRVFNISLGKKLILISILPIILVTLPKTGDIISVISVLTGAGWGIVINEEFIHFRGIDGTILQRIYRLLVGTLGVLVFYFGLKIFFPKISHPAYSIFYFIRYAILGLWMTAGAPWVFSMLKIVGGDE